MGKGITLDGLEQASVIISLQPNLGGPEAIEFFRQLGLCVAVWAYVDRRLYQIFHHAVGLEQKQSALFYYADRTFGRRLQLVDRALKAELPKSEFVSSWRPIHDETKTLSYTRNIFVHQPTHRLGTAQDGKPLDIYSIHIEPYERILNEEYPGLLGKERLEIEDLKKHETEILLLESKLTAFAWQMGGRRAAKKRGSD
jgi:hypothetical protein